MLSQREVLGVLRIGGAEALRLPKSVGKEESRAGRAASSPQKKRQPLSKHWSHCALTAPPRKREERERERRGEASRVLLLLSCAESEMFY